MLARFLKSTNSLTRKKVHKKLPSNNICKQLVNRAENTPKYRKIIKTQCIINSIYKLNTINRFSTCRTFQSIPDDRKVTNCSWINLILNNSIYFRILVLHILHAILSKFWEKKTYFLLWKVWECLKTKLYSYSSFYWIAFVWDISDFSIEYRPGQPILDSHCTMRV